MYSDSVKKLIEQDFTQSLNQGEEFKSQSQDTVNDSDRISQSDYIDVLKSQVADLKKTKNDQADQIATLHTLLNQQQQLSLQDKKQLQEQKDLVIELEASIASSNSFEKENDVNVPEMTNTSENAKETHIKRKWWTMWKKN